MSVGIYLTVVGLTILISIVLGIDMSKYITTNTIDIKNTMSVDAEKNAHGRWEYADDGRFVCNNCKSVKVAPEQFHFLISTGCWNYCPNCGARMDGGN